jgi:acetoacetyl-[acyl-carrier protein] synthase
VNVLPVIVGYGGINAAGRSVGDYALKRMVYENLSNTEKIKTIESLAQLTSNPDEKYNLDNSLIRKLSKNFFEEVSHRNPNLPGLAAGQLPTGFNPSETYNARQHPRSLAMSIFAASDALKSIGLNWDEVSAKVGPENVSCLSGCAISTADKFGMGGFYQAQLSGARTTSKHLAMSLGEMSADFVHAYVLGSMGVTGNHTGACATFQYNLSMGIDLINSGQSKICFVGAAESGLVPEVYEGFAAAKGLAEDKNLINLQAQLGENTQEVNYRKACRPFGENVGMSIGESAQFVVLMADDLALELGCNIYGAALSSHIHADGYKKSISGPGAGNYITIGRVLNEVSDAFGTDALNRVLVHAHGTGTPQNRVTESHILSSLANAFGIAAMPVTAIKSHLAHSLAAAGGDQLTSMLGSWQLDIVPGISSTPELAENVYKSNLSFLLENQEIKKTEYDFAILNAKGFGGNNGTSLIMSPSKTIEILKQKHNEKKWKSFKKVQENTIIELENFDNEIRSQPPLARYKFGEGVIDGESELEFSNSDLVVKSTNQKISIKSKLPYKEFFKK